MAGESASALARLQIPHADGAIRRAAREHVFGNHFEHVDLIRVADQVRRPFERARPEQGDVVARGARQARLFFHRWRFGCQLLTFFVVVVVFVDVES